MQLVSVYPRRSFQCESIDNLLEQAHLSANLDLKIAAAVEGGNEF